MVQPVALIPLACLKCDTPLAAQPDEVAWVCTRCGQGLLLDESAENGLALLEIQYASGLDPQRKGMPLWVVEGRVQLERTIFASFNDKSREAQELWAKPRRFFIPASEVPLKTLADLGPGLLLNPPTLQPGPAAPFEPVTVSPADLPALAEFIVLAIEAGRSDMLKQVNIQVNLSAPVLWVLPWGQ
jgi:hypothetical protein